MRTRSSKASTSYRASATTDVTGDELLNLTTALETVAAQYPAVVAQYKDSLQHLRDRPGEELRASVAELFDHIGDYDYDPQETKSVRQTDSSPAYEERKQELRRELIR